MADDFFAGPIKKLAESGIGNTIDPAGGMGLTLKENGDLPNGIVGTSAIAPDAVTATEIATGAVTTTEILNGTIVNADISASAAIDISKITSGAWTTYTPALQGTGGAFTVGNGVISGRYIQIGKFVALHIDFTLGTTSVIPTVLTQFSFPVTSTAINFAGVTHLYDSSAGQSYMAMTRLFNTGTVFVITGAQPGVSVIGTVPFTWATGDLFQIDVAYEAA